MKTIGKLLMNGVVGGGEMLEGPDPGQGTSDDAILTCPRVGSDGGGAGLVEQNSRGHVI